MIEALARLFFAFIEATHRLTGSYGIDSLLLIAFVRTAMLPLTFQQVKTQRGMKVLQPKMKAIEPLRKEDPAKYNEAMMALYKEEGVNPVAGCLPMLIQLPIIFGLFTMLRDPSINGGVFLRETVLGMRMGAAPVALSPSFREGLLIPGSTASAWPFGADPSFLSLYWPGLLALGLYVLSMLLYQKLLTPAQPDGDQAKQMQMNSKLMTLVFVGLFLFFPVGLIMVWLAFNLLSIAQHLHISRILDRQEAAATAGAADTPAPPAPPAKPAGGGKRKGRKGRRKGG